MTDAPYGKHHVGNIDSKGAIHGTALTGVALRGGNLRGLFDKIGTDFTFGF